MVTARTLKGAQVYVTFYPDCEENVGGLLFASIYRWKLYMRNRQFRYSCGRYTDKKDPYAAAEELAREYIESIKEY